DEEKYDYINEGDLVHLVGIAKKDNNMLNFYPDFIQKIDDVNFETSHILNLIKIIKEFGKREFEADLSYSESIEMEDIESFVKTQESIKDVSEEEFGEENLDNLEVDYGDDMEITDNDLEETVFNFIKNNDKGNGISFNVLLETLHIDEELLKEILESLIYNTRVYTSENGNYKIYDF
ncbi:MAG: hypothetical protein ACTSO2_07920, partial [Promethearchaeota archaeon]